MTRTRIVTVAAGLLVVAGLGAPALAGPLPEGDRENVCLRLDPPGGEDGVCVWLPAR
jgi:hypothetical protein